MTCSMDAKQHLASILDISKLHRNSLRGFAPKHVDVKHVKCFPRLEFKINENVGYP